MSSISEQKARLKTLQVMQQRAKADYEQADTLHAESKRIWEADAARLRIASDHLYNIGQSIRDLAGLIALDEESSNGESTS